MLYRISEHDFWNSFFQNKIFNFFFPKLLRYKVHIIKTEMQETKNEKKVMECNLKNLMGGAKRRRLHKD